MDNTIVIVTILGPASLQNFPPNFPLALPAKLGRSQQQDEALHSMNLAMPALAKTGLLDLTSGEVRLCSGECQQPRLSTVFTHSRAGW